MKLSNSQLLAKAIKAHQEGDFEELKNFTNKY